MPSTQLTPYSPDLISTTGTYLGGPSNQNFKRHLAPSEWLTGDVDLTAVSPFEIGIHSQVSTETGHYAFEANLNGEKALERFFAVYLLSQLPAKAMDEAVETLMDMWEFYSPPVSLTTSQAGTPVAGFFRAGRVDSELLLDED